ncbi:MAG: molybdopterin dinucleotide binding domain-containing protein, partial [Candidatus Helarchaeota archaeon]
IISLTRKFAETPRALIYGRMGICASTFSTLNVWAIEVLNIITGKLDRPGGRIFGQNIVNTAKIGGLIGLGSYDERRSRVGNYPEVMGAFPLGTLAREILAPRDPVRVLYISAGNPILSAPNSNEFKKALKNLELCVVLDLYINETALEAAHYVLPVTTPLENANYHALYNLNYQLFPHVEYNDPPLRPDRYGPKAEWEILLALIRLMNLTAFDNKPFDMIIKLYSKIFKKFNPEILIKILLLLGQILNKRIPYLSSNALTLRKLKKEKIILTGRNQYGVIGNYLLTKNKQINLFNEEIKSYLVSCKDELHARMNIPEQYQLGENEFLLIGRRYLKTSNSWMHNVESMWKDKHEPRLLINTQDASRLGLKEQNYVVLESIQGKVELPIEITDNIIAGVLCYPHGWGHKNPMLSFANQHPGENINVLTNSYNLDKISGMPVFNGCKVRLIPC